MATRRALANGFWIASGAIVIVFILVAALGAIDPTEAVGVTAVVLLLAVLWLAHEWGQLWRDERSGSGRDALGASAGPSRRRTR